MDDKHDVKKILDALNFYALSAETSLEIAFSGLIGLWEVTNVEPIDPRKENTHD